MRAIVTDIHGTLLDKDLQPNKDICNIIKTLSKNYQLIAYTAAEVSSTDKLHSELLKKTGINFVEISFLNSDLDDVDKKKLLLRELSNRYKISCIIDNNKKVSKHLAKDFTVLKYML